jgi:hypothetical protein
MNRSWLEWAVATAVAFGVFGAAREAAADPEGTPTAPAWRAGIGGGGSWLPVDNGTVTGVVQLSGGVDLTRVYGLRLTPTFQYSREERYPNLSVGLGYLAVDNVFRVAPLYAVSLSPLVGGAFSSKPPPCFDVCYQGLGNGPIVGVSTSPATFLVGPDRQIEVGLHAQLFVLTNSGLVYAGGYLGIRWLFV